PAADLRLMVVAANDAGLVTHATNAGAFFGAFIPSTTPAQPKHSTKLALVSPPTTGAYRSQATFTGLLTQQQADGKFAPLPGKRVSFTLGGQRLSAVTGSNGQASVTMTLMQLPDTYTLRAAFEEEFGVDN